MTACRPPDSTIRTRRRAAARAIAHDTPAGPAPTMTASSGERSAIVDEHPVANLTSSRAWLLRQNSSGAGRVRARRRIVSPSPALDVHILTIKSNGHERRVALHRRHPGHAGHADPEGAEPRADARLRHRPAHRADLAGRVQGESRIAADRLPAARARRAGRRRLAADREQPPRQGLFADPGRPQAPRRRDRAVGAAGRGGGPPAQGGA